MLYRFPNVVVAQVTRESVQQAIANGITAQQVLNNSIHQPLHLHEVHCEYMFISESQDRRFTGLQQNQLKKHLHTVSLVKMQDKLQ